MELRDLGEFGLIDRIERRVRRRGVGSSRDVILGMGDDAAVLRPRPGEDVVLSTDAAVEGVHFDWRHQTAHNVGRRALVANLSDLAAMGARPLGFTCSFAGPPTLSLARVDRLVDGLLHEAARCGCPLVGGNVTRAREVSLHIAAVGAATRGRLLTREGARAGDRIFVTGRLGASALALARARRGLAPLRQVPVPRLEAGRRLARLAGVGGCIDVSDGLDADLGHLLAPAGLGAEVDAERIPTPRGFAAACARLSLDPAELARRGGEDYELLFTVRPGAASAAGLSRRLGVPVTEIGRVTRRPARGGAGGATGWRHF